MEIEIKKHKRKEKPESELIYGVRTVQRFCRAAVGESYSIVRF